jgi:hypothetical protein
MLTPLSRPHPVVIHVNRSSPSQRRIFLPNGGSIFVQRTSRRDRLHGPAERNLCFPNIVMSRQHAILEADMFKVYIQDVGSLHGTSINGHRLATYDRRVVHEGDEITFGVPVMSNAADFDPLVATVVEIKNHPYLPPTPEAHETPSKCWPVEDAGRSATNDTAAPEPGLLPNHADVMSDMLGRWSSDKHHVAAAAPFPEPLNPGLYPNAPRLLHSRLNLRPSLPPMGPLHCPIGHPIGHPILLASSFEVDGSQNSEPMRPEPSIPHCNMPGLPLRDVRTPYWQDPPAWLPESPDALYADGGWPARKGSAKDRSAAAGGLPAGPGLGGGGLSDLANRGQDADSLRGCSEVSDYDPESDYMEELPDHDQEEQTDDDGRALSDDDVMALSDDDGGALSDDDEKALPGNDGQISGDNEVGMSDDDDDDVLDHDEEDLSDHDKDLSDHDEENLSDHDEDVSDHGQAMFQGSDAEDMIDDEVLSGDEREVNMRDEFQVDACTEPPTNNTPDEIQIDTCVDPPVESRKDLAANASQELPADPREEQLPVDPFEESSTDTPEEVPAEARGKLEADAHEGLSQDSHDAAATCSLESQARDVEDVPKAQESSTITTTTTAMIPESPEVPFAGCTPGLLVIPQTPVQWAMPETPRSPQELAQPETRGHSAEAGGSWCMRSLRESSPLSRKRKLDDVSDDTLEQDDMAVGGSEDGGHAASISDEAVVDSDAAVEKVTERLIAVPRPRRRLRSFLTLGGVVTTGGLILGVLSATAPNL